MLISSFRFPLLLCRTPHGVRGLKYVHRLSADAHLGCRTPHGVRGLKSAIQQHTRPHHASHPSRGAWIEIAPDERARGQVPRRTPHGVRGLKLDGVACGVVELLSHPSRGAWIEISTTSPRQSRSAAAHPSRGAWIEIGRGWCGHHRRGRRTPHGVRGLKYHDSKENPMNNVAPLTGCVD